MTPTFPELTFELTRPQSEFFRYLFRKLDPDSENWTLRHAVVAGSRGLGKSYGAAAVGLAAVSELMQIPPTVLNKQVVILAPTERVVKRIYTPLFNDVFQLHHLADSHNMSENFWQLPTGVILNLFSFEAVERLRGQGIHTLINDEMSSWSSDQSKIKEAVESILLPCVLTRWSARRSRELGALSPGRSLTISSTKGYNYFHDIYQRAKTDTRWKSWKYTYRDSPFLSSDEIELERSSMDPVRFSQEYEASFEESGHRVYHTFKTDTHVTSDLPPLDDEEPLLVGLDFNVGLMASVLCAERGPELHVLYEVVGLPNTTEFAKDLWDRWGYSTKLVEKFGQKRFVKIPRNILIYPDPSGRSNKTSATLGTTDFSILENKRREHPWNFKVFAPKAAPKVVDSVASVNRLFEDARGVRRLWVHPRCKETIKSLQRTSWLETNSDAMSISKKESVEHLTDALRYLIHFRYPAAGRSKVSVARSQSFF